MRVQQTKLVDTANDHQKQLNEIEAELDSQRKNLEEFKSLTGADVRKIAENVENATEIARVNKELLIAINDSKTKVVSIGWKPTRDISDFKFANKFLRDIMTKSDEEIHQIGLVSAKYTRLDTNFPTGVLTFNNENSATALLQNKKKAKAKNIKLKPDIPMAYKDTEKKLHQAQYRRFQKGFGY